MRTVTVRELKSNPSAALRDARDGSVLITNRGLPEALIVSIAGGQGSADLEGDIAEAVRVVRGLAERHGARAVRAVDRAATRRTAERRALYGSNDEADVSLATLTATLQAVVAPRRIVRRRSGGPGEVDTVVVVVDRELARAEIGRVEAAAEASGRHVVVRLAEGDEPAMPDEDVLFDRRAVPLRAIDRLIADGRARPARPRRPLPPRAVLAPGVSATAEVLDERAGDAR